MTKPIYRQAKRQKELARKNRQEAKRQRRSARTEGSTPLPQAGTEGFSPDQGNNVVIPGSSWQQNK